MSNFTMTQIVLMAAVCVLMLGALWWAVRKGEDARVQKEQEELDAQEKATRAQIDELVEAGTHNKQCQRLCITCGDGVSVAAQRAFRIVQGEGVLDLVRRRFGAPARYRIIQAKKTPKVYCEECAELMKHEHASYILAFEQHLRDSKRDATVQLRRWVKVGCNEVARARVEQFEKDSKRTANKPPAKVVPLHGNGQSG